MNILRGILNTEKLKVYIYLKRRTKMIIFQNEGELDINAIRTMGVSVKDDGAIGFFGTGLKYAIAVLLRENQRITIWSGMTKLEFGTERITVRGKGFDVVTMNGESLNFTTELGKTWEMWMAFRELYCNCKDEGGNVGDSDSFNDDLRYELGHDAGLTVVEVEGDKFKAEYYNRHQNFLEGEPLFSDGNVEIHDRPSPYIYNKGVRIHTSGGLCQYSYNLLNKVDLTEDRTMKYSWEADDPIARCVMQATDPVILYKVICANELSYERSHLQFNADKWSPEFEQLAVREYKADAIKCNGSLQKFIHKIKPPGLYEPAELTKVQTSQLNKALKFCHMLGYSGEGYKTTVVETLGPTVMAMALRPTREIIISKASFDKGTKFLASTLLEEVIHLREGLSDNTTAMQTYLFDKIISLGEELQGEPL